MASIKQYRKKIKSAKNIAKLTRAMQLVSASKMRRSQEQASAGKEYSKGLIDLSSLLSGYLDPSLHPLMRGDNPEATKQMIVLVAPEKGLCGSLITNLAKKVALTISEVGSKNLEFITIGKKANQIAKRLGVELIAEFEVGLSSPKYEIVPPIARLVEERFIEGSVKQVSFIFSEFVNTMTQVPTQRVLLPLSLVVQEQENAPLKFTHYLFEPSPKEIIDPFLDIYLGVEIYQILLEAFASEQSARMVAMKNASDNAAALIDSLTIDYNKARQTAITSEILDIGNATQILT